MWLCGTWSWRIGANESAAQVKAMILAAGLGTRLRPLTDERPKALVEVGGRTLLEIAIARLKDCGVREVIVNVHHFPDMIAEYLKKNGNFGMRVEISREEVLLDTGGGLKKAAWFLREGVRETEREAEEPFILHNVDVVSTIDLSRMVAHHKETGALATLAVQKRESSRQLLFDQQGQLSGRRMQSAGRDVKEEWAGTRRPAEALAFCGIHAVSPRLFGLMSEDGIFSIIAPYLRLAASGEKVLAFRADEYYWRDLGKPEDLLRAAEDAKQKAFS
jgi:mannose-1-phosphate guanylyltransferase